MAVLSPDGPARTAPAISQGGQQALLPTGVRKPNPGSQSTLKQPATQQMKLKARPCAGRFWAAEIKLPPQQPPYYTPDGSGRERPLRTPGKQTLDGERHRPAGPAVSRVPAVETGISRFVNRRIFRRRFQPARPNSVSASFNFQLAAAGRGTPRTARPVCCELPPRIGQGLLAGPPLSLATAWIFSSSEAT